MIRILFISNCFSQQNLPLQMQIRTNAKCPHALFTQLISERSFKVIGPKCELRDNVWKFDENTLRK